MASSRSSTCQSSASILGHGCRFRRRFNTPRSDFSEAEFPRECHVMFQRPEFCIKPFLTVISGMDSIRTLRWK